MTTTQINYFMTLVKEHSFTRAANVLYISQPAISKSISMLEEELDMRLFERGNNIVTLTPAGNLLYEYFTKCENEYRLLMGKLDKLRIPKNAPVRIGCPDTWNPSFFRSKLLDHFNAKHPEITLSVECCKLSDLIINLTNRNLDIVITHDFYDPNLYGIQSKYLTDSGFGILYSQDRFKNVNSLADLKDMHFLLFDSDIQKRLESVIKDICSGVYMPITRNVGQLSTALFDMACGKGVMLFSDWDSVITNPAYGYLPLDRRIPIKMMYSSDNKNASVETFVNEVPSLFAG